jgi:hypothetical protein
MDKIQDGHIRIVKQSPQTDRQTDRPLDRQTEGQTKRLTDTHMNRIDNRQLKDGQMDRKTYRLMDLNIYGQTDKRNIQINGLKHKWTDR